MTSIASQVTTLAYGAQQLGMLVPATLTQRFVRMVGGAKRPAPDPRDVRKLHAQLRALFERDLANVESGDYPRQLLFSLPVGSYVRALPSLVMDLPRSIRRRRTEDWREIPEGTDRGRYPAYFRRTFHWQTDGYLSRRSARIYDVGVEFLFAGTADVMRRQVIPPISRYLREHGGAHGKRALDVACGTGRSLVQLHAAHPDLRLYGLDLSPYYAQEARENLRDVPDVSIVAENAESMPFADGLFDVVTSVYLFHELPRAARRKVVREMKRVLRPGGLLVLEDSAQYAEAGELAVFLERFPEDFHEPFYRDYLADDLAAILEEEGFELERVERAFVAKVVAARTPSK
ncbi:MAG: class I SAM-dependent methyltransferase [Sandaracinaceae bacterium]